jgi:anti-sigma28 factor (negative regulator of flagellin synthesis)
VEVNRSTNVNSRELYPNQSTKVSKKQDSIDSSVLPSKDSVEISSKALAVATNGKMSAAERSALIEPLKAEQQQNKQKLIDFVRESFASQGNSLSNINDIWKFIASGEYTVDAETKAAATEAISEDGEFGVKKTSERIFQFALALTGGDEKLMKEMQKAIKEGFSQATEAWGKELPSITSDTYDAVTQKFDGFYNSLKENV